MTTKPATLKDFVARRMAETGLSQTDIANKSGLSISDVNGIVQGRIKLPGAGKRRDLARALGVSHLDLLVEAGEIQRSEIEAIGMTGVVNIEPERAMLIDKLTRVRLFPKLVTSLDSVLDMFLEERVADRLVEHRGSVGDTTAVK